MTYIFVVLESSFSNWPQMNRPDVGRENACVVLLEYWNSGLKMEWLRLVSTAWLTVSLSLAAVGDLED